MIDIYQPNDVPRWRKRMDGYAQMRRNILYTGGGTGFSKMSTFVNYDANTRITVLNRPAGSGGCCCCECTIAPGGGVGPVCKFGTTPHQAMIFASGITYPGTCFTRAFGSAQGSGPDPNGTWVLDHPTPVGGSVFCCDWGSNNPGPVLGGSITYYTDSACSAGATTNSFEGSGWAVGYDYDSATGKYYRGVNFTSIDGTTGEAFYAFVNFTEVAPEIDCSLTVTLSNQAVFGTLFTPPDGGASNYAIGSGGSVVLSPA